MSMLMLVGCSAEFGLGSASGPHTSAGDLDAAADTAEQGPEGEGQVPVAVLLEGTTWSLDIAAVTFSSPPGIGSLVELMDTTELLFSAVDESADSLSLVTSMAGADGAQNPCERVVTLPPARWDNPRFRIDEGVLRLTISNEPMDIADALLTATISADGTTWSGGRLAGTIDARQVNAGLGDEWDVCALVEDMGGECEPCDDGQVQCFELIVEDINARVITTGFDPYVDDGAC